MQAVLVVHRDREHANDLAEEAASWLIAHGQQRCSHPKDQGGGSRGAAPAASHIAPISRVHRRDGTSSARSTRVRISSHHRLNVGRIGTLGSRTPGLTMRSSVSSPVHKHRGRMMLEVVIEYDMVAGAYRA